MRLSSFLHPHLIKIKHKVTSSENVIRGLVKEICKEFPPDFEEKTIQIIMEREKLGPTAEKGISIPHARIENFKDLIIAISIPDKPIIVNGEKIKIFFLILAPKTSSNLYLNVLSAIAKLAKDSKLMGKILSCKKPEEIIKIIREADITIREDLTVKDIMEEEFLTISPEAVLKEAINLFCKKKSLFSLVVEKEILVGEITLLGIVKKGIPNYAMDLVNLRFLKTFKPLEEILQKEERIKVREVMFPITITLTPDSSIIEAIVKMTKEKRFFIPVVKSGKPIGVVTIMDFITRILRA